MKFSMLFALLSASVPGASGAAATVHLVQKPGMNKTEIVFSYAGDLWRVSRQGGAATRLTSGAGVETEAAFSPDGNTIAFTGEYDGNVDVFTLPVTGGVPKRVTWHPDADRVAGWTPDGKRILFRSNRQSFSRYTQLYSVPAEGGPPEVLPLPMGCMGAYSPDGKRMVYAPLDGGQFAPGFSNFVAWKRYRGGAASYLWLVNFADLSTVKIPRTDSNDIYPMWIGDKIYFLSDRNGPMTLFRYDPQSKKVDELIKNTGKDLVSASAGPGGIVYEQFGQVHIYDLAAQKEHAVLVEIAADLAEVRPHFQNVAREIRGAAISPTGVRMVFEAHGEILTAPAEKGGIRNLTNTPGVMERTPSWSPDGKSIAYFSDESGEYALHIKAQNGEGETKKIVLAGKSAYYFDPRWAPDSKHIAFNDNQNNLWVVEIASGKLA
jgi:tricorn protease